MDSFLAASSARPNEFSAGPFQQRGSLGHPDHVASVSPRQNIPSSFKLLSAILIPLAQPATT